MSRRRFTPYTPPRRRPAFDTLLRIEEAFDREALRRVCEMPESEFASYYKLGIVSVDQPSPANFYAYQDNGSDILAVAHLDTVANHFARECHFVRTEAGEVVFSRALDDRLGAYIILELLPKLGLKFDILLTVGEESGQSTASFFDPPKAYNWMIEFDRGGTDVVLYQYEDRATRELVLDCGAVVGEGIFSDISVLDHLECKGFNWGVGYQDYHSDRSHAFLADTWDMVERFLVFHEENADSYLFHEDNTVPVDGRYGFDLDRDADGEEDWWRDMHSIPLSEDVPEVMSALWAEEG